MTKTELSKLVETLAQSDGFDNVRFIRESRLTGEITVGVVTNEGCNDFYRFKKVVSFELLSDN